jgi:hypothetical protein
MPAYETFDSILGMRSSGVTSSFLPRPFKYVFKLQCSPEKLGILARKMAARLDGVVY